MRLSLVWFCSGRGRPQGHFHQWCQFASSEVVPWGSRALGIVFCVLAVSCVGQGEADGGGESLNGFAGELFLTNPSPSECHRVC